MIKFYVGGDAGSIQGEPQLLHGPRCFTASIRLKTRLNLPEVDAMLDSGAFSDKPSARLTPEGALQRQLKWETDANRLCGFQDWRVNYLVSYDDHDCSCVIEMEK